MQESQINMNRLLTPPPAETHHAASAGPKIDCSTCLVGRICLPASLTSTATDCQMVQRRIKIVRGDHLYQLGEAVGERFYAVRYGSFKTYHLDPGGLQRIVGFHISGDHMALNTMGLQNHRCGAIALEDSEVCEISYDCLHARREALIPLQRHFYTMLSKEIAREQDAALLLRNTRAEQRLTAFLLGISLRYAARGYSSTSFRLHMSRQDIADFLGLTPESVSRLLFGLKSQGLLEVSGRAVTVLDAAGLQRLAGGYVSPAPADETEARQPQLATAHAA
jgi:CRP/FNR family transcriptional regulator